MGFIKRWLVKTILLKRSQLNLQFHARTLSNGQHLTELRSTKTMSFIELKPVFKIWAVSSLCTGAFLALEVLCYLLAK